MRRPSRNRGGIEVGRVLVLGSGQVGAFAARSIAESGVEVVAADLDPAIGYFSRFGPKDDCPLEELDVHDEAAVIALAKTHAVETIIVSFGLGGVASTQEPERAWDMNVRGPQAVARAALEASVKRIVFVSSFAVYGRPAVERLSETAPTQPESDYGRTKLAAEEALAQFRADGLDVLILRPCGVFGPVRYGRGSHSARLIEDLLVGGLRGIELTLQASSVSADEYLYIKDLGRAIAAAAAIEETPHYVFNIGTGVKVTAEDLYTALRQVVPDLRLRIELVKPDHERAMPPLDVTRARCVLGFAPNYGLADALIDYASEAGFAR
jgi:UDP-glucose 4-epimerase